jgi:hypothetical protein
VKGDEGLPEGREAGDCIRTVLSSRARGPQVPRDRPTTPGLNPPVNTAAPRSNSTAIRHIPTMLPTTTPVLAVRLPIRPTSTTPPSRTSTGRTTAARAGTRRRPIKVAAGTHWSRARCQTRRDRTPGRHGPLRSTLQREAIPRRGPREATCSSQELAPWGLGAEVDGRWRRRRKMSAGRHQRFRPNRFHRKISFMIAIVAGGKQQREGSKSSGWNCCGFSLAFANCGPAGPPLSMRREYCLPRSMCRRNCCGFKPARSLRPAGPL